MFKLQLLPHTKSMATVHLPKSQSCDDQADDPTKDKAALIVCSRDSKTAAFIMLMSTYKAVIMSSDEVE